MEDSLSTNTSKKDRIKRILQSNIDPVLQDYVNEKTQPIRDKTRPLRENMGNRLHIAERQQRGKLFVINGTRHAVGNVTRGLLGIKKKGKK